VRDRDLVPAQLSTVERVADLHLARLPRHLQRDIERYMSVLWILRTLRGRRRELKRSACHAS
jgi:hypothetical protein